MDGYCEVAFGGLSAWERGRRCASVDVGDCRWVSAVVADAWMLELSVAVQPRCVAPRKSMAT